MKKAKKFSISIVCFLWSYFAAAQFSPALQVKEVKLSNGLTVWLNEDHTQSKVFGAVVVRAGSKDCPNTGIAHYFEHIMFKGTDQIGTTDYKAEKVYLDSIALKYDQLARTSDAEARKEIQKEINRLSIKAADYAIPNEFSRLISRYGGTNLNAYTSYDCTAYYNIFSPSYFRQWAELNSARFLHPVFRLFQSELETVYEEKNMYDDAIGNTAIEKFTDRFYAPHPYRYPIIGSTENLKNPRLSEMEAFFKKYYVAPNMGLILCGDFRTEEIMPVLEQTFSRLPSGEIPERKTVTPAPFNGREEIQIKLPLPLIRMMALGFRGIPANHPDHSALNLVLRMLNNDNGTGYLDLLSADRKLLGAATASTSMDDAGMIFSFIVPKLFFQSKSKAEKLVWQQINRIKEGDFSDELFQSLKQEELYNFEKNLEDMSARSHFMITLFSQGKNWDEFMKEPQRIVSLTKEDIINTAKKYFGENYLYASKKKGNYPKDNLQKPPFDPIIPKHIDAISEYGKKLEKIPAETRPPRLVDFGKDTHTVSLSPKATLYVTPNPLNNLFSLDIRYHIGTLKSPRLSLVESYIPLLGTDSLTYEAFRKKLQNLGSTMEIYSHPNDFTVSISGFDAHFEETMLLIGEFLDHVKADKKKLKTVKDMEKVDKKSFFKSPHQIADAAIEKIIFGTQSVYLNKPSYAEVKKVTGEELVNLFKQVQETECSLHYSGTLSVKTVCEGINKAIDADRITRPASTLWYRDKRLYEKPLVYIFNQPHTSQSILYGYVPNPTPADDRTNALSQLFGNYFGIGMSSLLFQELREFRSYAYNTYGYYSLPSPKFKEKTGALIANLSTQADKTTDALCVLDSLIRFMPVKPQKIEEAKKKIISQCSNSFPEFRNISFTIENWKQQGYTEDPNGKLVEWQKTIGVKDLEEFYRNNIQERPVVYLIVGDEKKIDKNKLAAFGEVILMQKEEIYR